MGLFPHRIFYFITIIFLKAVMDAWHFIFLAAAKMRKNDDGAAATQRGNFLYLLMRSCELDCRFFLGGQ